MFQQNFDFEQMCDSEVPGTESRSSFLKRNASGRALVRQMMVDLRAGSILRIWIRTGEAWKISLN